VALRGISLSVKLITVSTILLVVVVVLFGVMNRWQSLRIFDDATRRLQQELTGSLRRTGTVQLKLLSETTRITMMENDYSTLQTIIKNVGRNDARISAVAFVDKDGTVLAHGDAARNGKKATGAALEAVAAQALTVRSGVAVSGVKSITFTTPVKQGDARLGTLFLAYSLAPLEAELAKADQLKRKESRASLRTMLFIGLLAVLVGLVLTIIQGLRIIRPLQALAHQANQIAGGDLQARVKIHSQDEIGLLGDRFNYMAEQVRRLMNEAMVKASMEKEMEVASAIQSTLVPDEALVQREGCSLAGYFKPASQCGGDWWNYYDLADGTVLILIGDVTGHGFAPAMITAAAKGAATTLIEVHKGRVELKNLLRLMNAAIHDTARGQFAMTCFASIYNSKTGTLSFGNAGHHFPYLYSAKAGELTTLAVRGNRLGDLKGSDYEIREVKVEPDDVVIWYTDGVVEGEDARGEAMGERRFRASIMANAGLPPQEARDRIIDTARGFYGEVPPADDITLVVGKFS